jgi:all-trans-retinol 13,14-reductase
MNDSWDVIVIGSGLGGLTCAAYLSALGKRVLVLEHHYVAGGNSHVFRRHAQKGELEFEFDVGVHYIGDCGPQGQIPTVLRGVGIEGKIEFLEMDPDGFDTLVFPDFTFRVPKGWDKYRERLIEAFPDDETGLHLVIDVLENVAKEAGRVSLPVKPEDLPRMMEMAPNFMRWGLRPLAELFDEAGLGMKARAVLTAESGDYASPPSRVPVILHSGLMDHYLRDGAYYPKGGGQVFAGHLVDVVRANGGEVRTRARVQRIMIEDGRAAGVELADGTQIRSQVTVSNADLKRTFLDLVGEQYVSPQTTERIRNFRMSTPIFCVYLGLDCDLSEQMPITNFWCIDTYDIEGIYTQCTAGVVPRELPIFITVASIKDPNTGAIAPRGYSNVQVMTMVPPDPELWHTEEGPAAGEKYQRNPEYRTMKEALTDVLIKGAERVLPGIADHIVWKEAATPITQERYTLSTDGTSYGIELSTDQFGPLRPGWKTDVPGLFLVGASTMTGHGIVGTMRGGVYAAGAVLGRDLMSEIRDGAVFGVPGKLTAGGPGWDPWKASF